MDFVITNYNNNSVASVKFVTIDEKKVPLTHVEVLEIEEDLTGKHLYTISYKGEIKKSYITTL